MITMILGLTILKSDIEKVFSDSTKWIDNKNTSQGIDFEFSQDSSYVIINNIDYLYLYPHLIIVVKYLIESGII